MNVKGYIQVRANLTINRDEISDEMDRIVELLNVRTECRYRYAQKKESHSVLAKNADCTCIHSTKNKVQRWATLHLHISTLFPVSQGMRLPNF